MPSSPECSLRIFSDVTTVRNGVGEERVDSGMGSFRVVGGGGGGAEREWDLELKDGGREGEELGDSPLPLIASFGDVFIANDDKDRDGDVGDGVLVTVTVAVAIVLLLPYP